MKNRRWLSIVLMVVGISLVGYFAWSVYLVPPPPVPVVPPSSSSISPAPVPSSEPSSSEPEEADPTLEYPEGRLFITGERSVYQDGAMTLSVPRLAITDMPVWGDVSEATLEKGIGLYDYSQIPGKGNRNVSIAGHRDLFGNEFYYIDTITEGDLFYLTYQGKRYTYTYKDTKVIEEDDWTPIHIQGFSCLTLTSCEPLGIASHRIVTRAELTKTEDA